MAPSHHTPFAAGTLTRNSPIALSFFTFFDPENGSATLKPFTSTLDLQSPDDYPLGDAPTLKIEFFLGTLSLSELAVPLPESCKVKLGGRDCSCSTNGTYFDFSCSGESFVYDGAVLETLGTNPDLEVTDFLSKLIYVTVTSG